MTCRRCHGFMCPVDLLVGASGSRHDRVCGWRCVACGEIIDLVIVQNRIRAKDQRCVRRERKPRQSVHGVFIENRD
jgi:hypothetical protein